MTEQEKGPERSRPLLSTQLLQPRGMRLRVDLESFCSPVEGGRFVECGRAAPEPANVDWWGARALLLWDICKVESACRVISLLLSPESGQKIW
jgi:hypothetical protein